MFAPKITKAQTKAPENPTRKLAPQPSTLVARPFGGGAVEQARMARMLQATIGNQATLRYLTKRLSNLPAKGPGEHHPPEVDRVPGEAPSTGWNFSKIPIFPPDRPNQPQARSSLSAPPPPGVLQPKLAAGEVNDPLEHEADRVADQVMGMPVPGVSIAPVPLQLSRECATCEEEEAQTLQTTAAGTSEAPGIVHEVLRSCGQPLDAAPRAFFEPRFGHDFSQVRVHTDARAAESARAVNAVAYTAGRNVVFGSGRYAPASDAGRKLIAHELTHVVQQRARTFKEGIVQRQKETRVGSVSKNNPSDPDLAQGTSRVNLSNPDGHVASVYFATNQAVLDDSDKRVLATVYNAYQKYLSLRKVELLFIGYADYRGTEKYNMSLGLRRAEAVSSYFLPLTYSPNYSFGVSSAGESEVPQVGTTSSELSPYRRVDIIASPIKKPPPIVEEEKKARPGYSTKFMIRIDVSGGLVSIAGVEAVAFEVFDIENNKVALFVYAGGAGGLSVKALPSSGATAGGSWKPINTSIPIRLEDFEGRAEHGSAGVVVGRGGQMEHLYLHGPEGAGAEQVKVGWIGLSKGFAFGLTAGGGKAWLTGGPLEVNADYLKK